MRPDDAIPAPENLLPQPEAAWPLTPAERREIGGLFSVFASSMVGGAMVLFSLGGLIPATVHTAGATRGMRIDRERQRRCLELGITPQELAALEQGELEAGE